MDVQGLGHTDTGLVRKNNEDSFIVDIDLGLYVVCDGMGGARGGEVAAEVATTTIRRVVHDRREVANRVERDPSHASDLVPVLEDALRQACRDVYNRAVSEPDLAGMGCTATAVLIAGSKAVMAHVGDTRLYLIREGEAHQLSTDHTLAADLVRQGMLEPEHLSSHPQRNVLTRVLGPQALVDVETLSFDLAHADRLVLCSDGLADYLPTEAWLCEQVSRTSMEDLPEELINFANARGGRDNITAIVIGAEGPPPNDLPRRSPQHVFDILGASFLFAELSMAQLARVVDRCEARSYDVGETVRNYGDIHDELLLIISGTVRVSTPDGRSAVAGSGQHLGANFVLRPRRTRAKITIEQQADILVLNQPNLTDLSSRRPWLGVSLLTRIIQRMSSDLDRLTTTDPQTQALAADLL